MKALVTGGSGFIGSHLIEKLGKQGIDFFNYDIKKGFDIKSYSALYSIIETYEPDVIFHLAGVLGTSELMEYVREAEEVNVIGTINVLDVCKEFQIPMVFTSKINPPDWINPYTITKQACDSYCKMYEEVWKVKLSILKYLNVYGPRQMPYPVQKFIPTFIDSALKGMPIPIWGTGNQVVDPVYVSDTVEATVKAWEKRCWGEVIEVGVGKAIPVIDIAKKVIEMTESKSRIVFLPMRSGEPLKSEHRICADPYLMEKLLGLYRKNMIPLEEGLRKTIDWWKRK